MIDQNTLNALARVVRSKVPGLNHEDSEDSIQQAVLEFLERDPNIDLGDVGGLIVNRAVSRALNHRRRRETRNASIQELEESGDAFLAEASMTDSLEAHIAIVEAEADPVLRERLRTTEAGASSRIMPRGRRHPHSRYTDEQINEARELRRQGLLFREIEARTGIERSYAAHLCRGRARLVPSAEGWTAEKAIAAVRDWHSRHGQPPTYGDGQRSSALPNPGTAEHLFGTWRGLLDAAGCPSPYADRRLRRWSVVEAATVIYGFFAKAGRWPSGADLAADDALPSLSTAQRLFGTSIPDRLGARVLMAIAAPAGAR